VVAKGIFATTETHSRVAVMCNSTAVSGLCEAYAYLMIGPFPKFPDKHGRRLQMLGRSFRAHKSWVVIIS
jgi:hypothetical protein